MVANIIEGILQKNPHRDDNLRYLDRKCNLNFTDKSAKKS